MSFTKNCIVVKLELFRPSKIILLLNWSCAIHQKLYCYCNGSRISYSPKLHCNCNHAKIHIARVCCKSLKHENSIYIQDSDIKSCMVKNIEVKKSILWGMLKESVAYSWMLFTYGQSMLWQHVRLCKEFLESCKQFTSAINQL